MDKKNINEKVKSILQFCNIFKLKIVDTNKIACAFEFVIQEKSNLASNVKSIIIFDEYTDKMTVIINENVKEEEKRHLIIQALAHYNLYCDINTESYRHVTTYDNDYQNEEVEYFTRSILLPKEHFEMTYNRIKDNFTKEEILEYLKYEYLVPKIIIEQRINDIKQSKLVKVRKYKK